MRDAVGPLLGQECNGMCLETAGCRAAAALDMRTVNTKMHRDVCVDDWARLGLDWDVCLIITVAAV
jgi:hypothetical protein